jgi:hypothetical protein
MAHQQSIPTFTHDAVSPVVPDEDDLYHQQQGTRSGRSSSDITPNSCQDDRYAYRVTIVDNKPQFTPASTLGPDDEFWIGKTGSTEVKVEQMLDYQVSCGCKSLIHRRCLYDEEFLEGNIIFERST